jgi:hypothetical protein
MRRIRYRSVELPIIYEASEVVQDSQCVFVNISVSDTIIMSVMMTWSHVSRLNELKICRIFHSGGLGN